MLCFPIPRVEAGPGSYDWRVKPPVPRRLGLFGGTFDPPHLGHLALARAVRDRLELDEVRFVVAHDPWQKSGSRSITPAAVRVEMVSALIDSEPGLAVDTREIDRGGPTYTVDTLESIRLEMPGTDLYLIVGADTASGIHTWVRPDDVLALSSLVVVNRGTQTADLPPLADAARVVHVSMDPVDASSTRIRAAVVSGVDVSEWTGPSVARVIATHRLYGAAR